MLEELRRRISAAIYGWEYPLLMFIYPGFDCGSDGRRFAKDALPWLGREKVEDFSELGPPDLRG